MNDVVLVAIEQDSLLWRVTVAVMHRENGFDARLNLPPSGLLATSGKFKLRRLTGVQVAPRSGHLAAVLGGERRGLNLNSVP